MYVFISLDSIGKKYPPNQVGHMMPQHHTKVFSVTFQFFVCLAIKIRGKDREGENWRVGRNKEWAKAT